MRIFVGEPVHDAPQDDLEGRGEKGYDAIVSTTILIDTWALHGQVRVYN
jgi:hypothetical protein